MNLPVPPDSLPPRARALVRRYERHLSRPNPFFPERVTLEISSVCNFRCPMCPRHFAKGEDGLMDATLWRRLVDEFVARGAKTLVPFFRGEPTIHPDWLELLAYAKARGVPEIQMATNGSRLDESSAARLLDIGIEFLSFSLDTADPAAYALARVGGSLSQTLANVEGFLRLRSERGLSKPVVQVSAVDTEWTRPGIPAFVRFWEGRVDRVRIYPEHSFEGRYGMLAPGQRLFPPGVRLPCQKPMTDMVVCWNGEVHLCCYDWERKRSLANVRASTMAEAWNGRAYEEIRQMHAGGIPMHPQENCVPCDHWQNAYVREGLTGVLRERGKRPRKAREEI